MMAAPSSTTAPTSPAFHSDDPEQTSDYRTLSVLAIISLLFGLASPLALAAPLLLAIPLFGIGISIVALRQIATNPTVITGRTAATIGLMLSVASLLAPSSRDLIFRAIRTSQAKNVSREFVELVVAGKLNDAFMLTAPGIKPTPPAQPVEGQPPPAKQTETPFESFSQQPGIGAIKAAGPDANVRFVATDSYEPSTFRNITIKHRYAVTPKSGGNPVEVVVTVVRSQLRGESMSRWLIGKIEDSATAAATAAQQPPSS